MLTATSYILNFFNDVETLTNSLANYSNTLLTLVTIHGNDKVEDLIKDLDETTQTQALAVIQGMRFSAIRAFVKYSSIMQKMPELKKAHEDIRKQYLIITTTPVPDFLVVEDFTLKINEALLTSVQGTELFRKSTEYLSKASSMNSLE